MTTLFLALPNLLPREAAGLPPGREWSEPDTFLVSGHTAMFAPGRIERTSEGGLIILGAAVGGIGTTAAGIRWADSLWVPFWELGDNISFVWPVDAPPGRHILVGMTTEGLGPNYNQDYMVVGELVGNTTAYVDSVVLLTAANLGYSAAASTKRRWLAAFGASTLSAPRLGHLYYSDTVGVWHEPVPPLNSGDNGTATLAVDDTTAMVAWASDFNDRLRIGELRGTVWDEMMSEPHLRGVFIGAPRLAHRRGGGYWLGWAGGDSLFVTGYRDGTWSPTIALRCRHADLVVHTANVGPHIGNDPSPYPVVAWSEFSSRTGIDRICVCIPSDSGFTVAEEILSPPGLFPVVLRDENGDVWLAWYRFFGGMYWQHTFVTATATDFAVSGHAGARRLSWNFTEPAPKSRWAVLRSRNAGPFEVADHVVATDALTMTWTDSSPPAGALRYKLRRECLDVRYQWESPEVRWPLRSRRPIHFTQVEAPLTPGQTLELSGAAEGPVTLTLYDVQGRRVYERRWQASGSGIDRIPFDAGRPVVSGVYFLRAVDAAGSVSAPSRIVLLR